MEKKKERGQKEREKDTEVFRKIKKETKRNRQGYRDRDKGMEIGR